MTPLYLTCYYLKLCFDLTPPGNKTFKDSGCDSNNETSLCITVYVCCSNIAFCHMASATVSMVLFHAFPSLIYKLKHLTHFI